MEKRYYNGTSLGKALHSFEVRYGLDSASFYEAARDEEMERIAHVPSFMRHSWVSFYLEWRQLSDDDGFGSAVKRELELA